MSRWSVLAAGSSFLPISSTTIWIQAAANSAATRLVRIKWTEARILLTSFRNQMKVHPNWLSVVRQAFISTGRSKQTVIHSTSWTNTSNSCSWVTTRHSWMRSTSQIIHLNCLNSLKPITLTITLRKFTQRGQWIRKLHSLKRNSGRQMSCWESLPLRSRVWERREKSWDLNVIGPDFTLNRLLLSWPL